MRHLVVVVVTVVVVVKEDFSVGIRRIRLKTFLSVLYSLLFQEAEQGTFFLRFLFGSLCDVNRRYVKCVFFGRRLKES